MRRYGFHGLSHAWASQRALLMAPGARRVVVCHLEALTPHQIAHALEHESGLLGLAGTADMRELLLRKDPDARLASACTYTASPQLSRR